MKNMIWKCINLEEKNDKIKTKKTNLVFEEYKLTTGISKESQILLEKEENEFARKKEIKCLFCRRENKILSNKMHEREKKQPQQMYIHKGFKSKDFVLLF